MSEVENDFPGSRGRGLRWFVTAMLAGVENGVKR
jgi:hypothetical protein